MVGCQNDTSEVRRQIREYNEYKGICTFLGKQVKDGSSYISDENNCVITQNNNTKYVLWEKQAIVVYNFYMHLIVLNRKEK